MHEKSTNCIPMQAEEREIQRCFTERNPIYSLFMKQIHCKTNGDLIYSSSVDLTEIPKFPFQIPCKI